jgi:hypothetical protein
LKIPKRYSETVLRRTDNTIAKRKRAKGQTMTYKTLHRKLRIEQHELGCIGRVYTENTYFDNKKA